MKGEERGNGKGQGSFSTKAVKIPPDLRVQPPPYLRDKVKIALPHLKEEISAVTEGGAQPLPLRFKTIEALPLSSIYKLRPSPMPRPQDLRSSSPRLSA